MTGAERRLLRETICGGADRASLSMALGEGEPARDYEELVRPSDFANEVDQLIGRALREGWLDDLIAAFVRQTERTDLIEQANGIRDVVAARQVSRAPSDGDGRSRRRWPIVAGGLVALVAALLAWLFWPAPDPNFKVRLVENAQPVRMRPVFVSPIVAGDTLDKRLDRVTDHQGEAFFAVALGTERLYRFGVKLDGGECTFPAFSVVDIREVLYELTPDNCRPVQSDVVLRSAAPRLPAGVAGVERRLPIDLEARRSRAPLGLPGAPLVLDRRAYTVGFDPAILSPRWVAFTVDTAKTLQLRRIPGSFQFDPNIPEEWQTGEEAYRNNSYDRGHLVRRSDALIGPSEEVARASEREINYYSVTVPQPAKTNQTTWLAVERYTTDLSARLGKIYAVAGPVYPDLTQQNGAYLTLGRSRTVVPLYLYRVLLRRSADGRWRALAFLVPNDGSIARNARQFATSVSEIERLTGLRFFPSLPDATAETLKANASASSFEAS